MLLSLLFLVLKKVSTPKIHTFEHFCIEILVFTLTNGKSGKNIFKNNKNIKSFILIIYILLISFDLMIIFIL